MSLIMRKPAFCKCDYKGADQLHSNRAADQLLYFCYIDSTVALLPKSEISNLKISHLFRAVQPGLCFVFCI